jgi:hypothetical protein
MTDDVGYGVEADPDDPWITAAKELTPDKSLARIATNAKFTVATVSVVGTALTALGLVSADRLIRDHATRIFALLAVGAALVAVILALAYLVPRMGRVNIEDLEGVEVWYSRQFRWAWLASAAAWLLIVAIVIAGIAAVVNVLNSDGDPPELMLQVSGTGKQRTVKAHLAVDNTDPGTLIELLLAAEGSQGGPLLEAKTTVGRNRTAVMDATVEKVPVMPAYRLTASVDGRERASVIVP